MLVSLMMKDLDGTTVRVILIINSAVALTNHYHNALMKSKEVHAILDLQGVQLSMACDATVRYSM